MSPAAEKLRRWKADPVAFVRQALHAEPDSWQCKVLAAAPTEQRILLKASKGPGKSTVLAWLGWWFALCHSYTKGAALSITGDNLRDGLWAELAKWRNASRELQAAFTWSAERIVANDHPETWFVAARTWSKDADASRQGEALAGIHADNAVVLLDEFGGFPKAVLATAEAVLANADPKQGRVAKMFAAGNPTQTEGPMYDACTTDRARWWVYEITGDPDDPDRAPRVSKEWAREQIATHGWDSDYVRVNVRGLFPLSQSNTMIGAEVAAQAARRNIGESEVRHDARIVGVDVARFGSARTVLQCRRGYMSWGSSVYRDLDTMVTADKVAYLNERWKPDAVFVDSNGIGAGVVDRLHQLGHYNVVGVDSASKPIGDDPAQPKILNRRAEMWWKMSQWMKHGVIANDRELIAELTGPRKRYNATQHLVLESKDDMEKRGLPSPDKADALALTFAAPVQKRPDIEIPGNPLESGRALGHDYDPFARRT